MSAGWLQSPQWLQAALVWPTLRVEAEDCPGGPRNYIKSDGFSGPDRLAMKPVLYLVTTRRDGRSLLAIFSSILWYLFAREAPPSWLAVSFMLQKCFTTEHPQICAVLGFTAAADRVIQRTYWVQWLEAAHSVRAQLGTEYTSAMESPCPYLSPSPLCSAVLCSHRANLLKCPMASLCKHSILLVLPSGIPC